MAEQLRVAETIAERTIKRKEVRNVGISTRLPSAERVVSVNARVEITEATVGFGNVVISGIIRATIFYASADDPSNVVKITRSFNFTERVSVSGARPGYDADVEAIISDIDFYLINDRLIGVEFTIENDIEITAPDTVRFITERPDLEIRERQIPIRREVRERNFTREFSSIVRIPTDLPDIEKVVSVDSNIQIIDTTTDFDRVIIRGIVKNNLLYMDSNKMQYVNLVFSFEESFVIRGITPDMVAFVEITVIDEDVQKIDDRRVKITVKAKINILVVEEETVGVPIEIISPGVFPVRRTVLVRRVVAEERTKILGRGRITVSEGNPDVSRIVRADGRIRNVSSDAESGGVLITGDVDVNVIYVADLPEQPVYFASDSIVFSSFVDIPGVTSDMNVFTDIEVDRVTASKISDREIEVRAVLDVNIVVTETVRVSVVTGISERPVEVPPVVETGFITYVVKSGDTLYLISKRYGITVDRLIEVNQITDPSQLRVGQQLLIPQ